MLPQLWRSKPDTVLPRLEQLRQLSRGALAEMRTLLLELRPDALGEMPLNDLLRQLVEATMARVPVRLELRSEGSPRRLPADVKVGLYRLAQEALNNVAKHAQAGQAEVHVRWADQAVVLRIRDDGRGFQPAAIPAGHLGVGFMRERAAAIAASLDITSRPAAGTSVTICWPAPRGRLRAPHPRARLLSAPRS